MVPDHGERMSGRNESDSRIQREGGLVSLADCRETSMRAFVQRATTQQGARESRVRRSRRSIEAFSGPGECWQGAATVDFFLGGGTVSAGGGLRSRRFAGRGLAGQGRRVAQTS